MFRIRARYLTVAENSLSDAVDRSYTVTEFAALGQPIDATPETTAAFVGRALRGPLNTPVLVTSFGEFKRQFGGIWTRSSLGPAVEEFFEHGGKNLYIVRVANHARGAMLCLPASGAALVLRATQPGSTENVRAAIDYDGIDKDNDELFNLTLQRVNPDTHLVIDQEIYKRVSYLPEAETYVGDALLTSSLVRMDQPTPTHRPEPTRSSGNQYDTAYIGAAQAGTDGTELSDYDLVGSAKERSGLFALQGVDSFDLLYLPPAGKERDLGPAALLAAEQFCRRRGAMLIVDPACDWLSAKDAVRGVRDKGYASPNMFAYFPRIRSRFDEDAPARVAGGAIAGLMCKLDRNYGPWQKLDLQGLGLSRKLAPAVEVDDEDMLMLARQGINAVVPGEAGKARIKGSVTLGRGSESHHLFTSLPVQRLCLRIVSSVDRATRWSVFEPHSERMSRRITHQVRSYLGQLFEHGAFESDDFTVQCDAGVARQEDESRHGVTIMLGFRPKYSRKRLLLTLHQTPAGCRVASTAFAPGELT